MANTINYGRSGRGGKNPYKTLTAAQRSKASVHLVQKKKKKVDV
jgi:predicted DNA-binding WGR domain protein